MIHAYITNFEALECVHLIYIRDANAILNLDGNLSY